MSTTPTTWDALTMWKQPGTAEHAAAMFVADGSSTLRWDQKGGPNGWLERIRPYTTPAYYRQLAAVVNGVQAEKAKGHGNPADAAYWAKFRSERKAQVAVVDAASPMTEGAGTSTSMPVVVDYHIVTSKAGKRVGSQPVQTEDLMVVKAGGRWLVSRGIG